MIEPACKQTEDSWLLERRPCNSGAPSGTERPPLVSAACDSRSEAWRGERRETKLSRATRFLHREYAPQFFFWAAVVMGSGGSSAARGGGRRVLGG